MKDNEFHRKFANTTLNERFNLLSNDSTSPLLGMTLTDVYIEIKKIDDKTRSDLIRKEDLLNAVEKFLE